MKYIIAVDIGTSSTKAIAFDLSGNMLTDHRIAYPVMNPRPTYAEQDPDRLLEACIDSIEAINSFMMKQHQEIEVIGVSFSCAMHGLIAVSNAGELLTNCIIWADTRSEAFAAALKGTPLGHDIYMHTGTPIHPMSPLCKLGWMRENMEETFENAAKFISVKEYLFYKLFNQYVVDFSIASATGLFDIHKQQWYTPSLEIAGISPDQLSTPVPITHVLRGMGPHYARRMHLPEHTPFVVGGSDGCLANLGAQAIDKGVASVTIGTSGAIRLVSKLPVTDPQERLFSYVLSPEMFVLGGAVNNGGNVMQWFQERFVEPATQVLETSIPILTNEASSVPAGAGGLIFLPYLAGERAPHWNANAKGVFFGIQTYHKRAHFIRAMMEGVIFGVYSVGKALEETVGDIDVLYVSGGFARSPNWVQMMADIFDKKVLIRNTVESSAVGAAIVGLHALQFIKGFTFAENAEALTAEFYPDKERHQVYMDNYHLFERLYEKLKSEF